MPYRFSLVYLKALFSDYKSAFVTHCECNIEAANLHGNGPERSLQTHTQASKESGCDSFFQLSHGDGFHSKVIVIEN